MSSRPAPSRQLPRQPSASLSIPNPAPASASGPSTRRTLFAARRPASASSQHGPAAAGAPRRHPEPTAFARGEAGREAAGDGAMAAGAAGAEEIIARDAVGSWVLDVPASLPGNMEGEAAEEREEGEARRRLIRAWRDCAAFEGGPEEGEEDAGAQERFADGFDIRDVLQADLEARFATLDEDGWMFGEQDADVEI